MGLCPWLQKDSPEDKRRRSIHAHVLGFGLCSFQPGLLPGPVHVPGVCVHPSRPWGSKVNT